MYAMRTRTESFLAAAVAVACLSLLVVIAPTPVSADGHITDFPGPWSISMVSDDEDVFQDHNVRFTPEDSSLFIYDGGEALYLEMTNRQDPLNGVEMRIQYGTRDLAEGFYPFAMSYKEPDAFYSDPIGTVHVMNDGTYCPVDQSHADIRSLHRDGDGVIDQLWMLVEMRCRGMATALFGEVRIGYTPTRLEAYPRVLRWPATTVAGATGKPVKVDVELSEDVHAPLSVSIVGRDRGSFVLKGTTCTDPGERQCQVTVGYRPQTVGVKRAQLRLEGGTTSRVVPLSGFAPPGRNSLAIESEPGDPIGLGKEYLYNARAGWQVYGYGWKNRIAVGVVNASWFLNFAPRDGDTLRVGTYLNTTTWPFQDNEPGLHVWGGATGCGWTHGSFEVRQLRFVSGRLANLDLSFRYHCEDNGAALTGRMRWNARSDVIGPGPVRGITAVRDGNRWKLTWQNPANADFAATEVRWYHGNTRPARLPDVGWSTQKTSRRSAMLTFAGDGPVTVSFIPIDSTGNTGQISSLVLYP